ncbi:hypothetical protein Aspvir_000159 [Aspergillus viridinutans]|uniref:Uncharacterized protein n=1 Tax=Aspergillus viridinutans TaxID=75553 RepID=A0A9P3BQ60_ASPVI|nr:uncharacterized protein Aspvir_000159 [Aspergillus viridinutans]GIJ98050.1 hypothetical protein Aspvir_000159 [Aspergillus viridinutans]
MAANKLAPREIKGAPGSPNLSDVVEDILNYNSDLPYEVIYIPRHPAKHGSNEYARDTHQTRLGAHLFREPQPFQIKAVPIEGEEEKHENTLQ